MITHAKILKDLRIQQKIEGETEDIKTMLWLLNLPEMKTSGQWMLLIDYRYHRHGPLSYQSHRFLYPSKLLRALLNAEATQENKHQTPSSDDSAA